MYKFFPEDKNELDWVLKIYENEISNRLKWIEKDVDELIEEWESSMPIDIIPIAIDIINHAMLVYRLIDKDGSTARNKSRAKERAEILHSRNPGIPDLLPSLKDIRNDYEHFEERLDEWAANNINHNYADLIMGDGGDANFGLDEKFVFRQLNGKELMFWNKKVNLQEVYEWVYEINEVILKNNPRG